VGQDRVETPKASRTCHRRGFEVLFAIFQELEAKLCSHCCAMVGWHICMVCPQIFRFRFYPRDAILARCDDASRSTDRDNSSSLGQLQHVNNIGASCGCEQHVDLIVFS